MNKPTALPRRRVLALGAGAAGLLVIRTAHAQQPEELATAVSAYTGGAPVTPGRVKLEIEKIVDNGNAVPVTVRVESPMTAAAHVMAVAIFNERNPQRDVARFTLGPRAGKAEVSTRIRLATSQKLVAIAKLSDGTYWSDTVSVVVALAACIEGEI